MAQQRAEESAIAEVAVHQDHRDSIRRAGTRSGGVTRRGKGTPTKLLPRHRAELAQDHRNRGGRAERRARGTLGAVMPAQHEAREREREARAEAHREHRDYD
jgi:hypothetical protein